MALYWLRLALFLFNSYVPSHIGLSDISMHVNDFEARPCKDVVRGAARAPPMTFMASRYGCADDIRLREHKPQFPLHKVAKRTLLRKLFEKLYATFTRDSRSSRLHITCGLQGHVGYEVMWATRSRGYEVLEATTGPSLGRRPGSRRGARPCQAPIARAASASRTARGS